MMREREKGRRRREEGYFTALMREHAWPPQFVSRMVSEDEMAAARKRAEGSRAGRLLRAARAGFALRQLDVGDAVQRRAQWEAGQRAQASCTR